MTGQVKEEILTRPLELGVTVDSGCLVFEPLLIRRHEFRTQPHSFTYVDVTGRDKTLQIPAEALAFTFCQVPIVVHHSGREQITAVLRDGTRATIHGGRLDRETSGHVFGRDGYVRSLTIETDVRHP